MIAGALVTMQTLPPKLNPIIRPLMDAIKKEEDPAVQVYLMLKTKSFIVYIGYLFYGSTLLIYSRYSVRGVNL